RTSLGMQAVLLTFVLPFMVLLVSLFVLMALTGGDELFSALLSFGLMTFYYIALSFNKRSLKKKFSFTIKQIK
ncbi:MAG: SoxR reducing system RseC family protein, partial [Bacteroides sp.]|nr:SoxR reducing system RseC family protein [Bacteroides sp.]